MGASVSEGSSTLGVIGSGGIAFASLNRLDHVLAGVETEIDAIAAAGLGRIQRAVGGGDQLVGGPAMGRERGNAERGGNRDLRCAVADRRGRHRTAQLFSALDGSFFCQTGKDQQELLATVAADDVACARAAFNLRSEDPQYFVTGKMSFAVVNRLEVIKIAHDHADWMPRTLRQK